MLISKWSRPSDTTRTTKTRKSTIHHQSLALDTIAIKNDRYSKALLQSTWGLNYTTSWYRSWLRPFRTIKVSPTWSRIDEDEIWNTISIHWDTLPPLEENTHCHEIYDRNKPVDKKGENFRKGTNYLKDRNKLVWNETTLHITLWAKSMEVRAIDQSYFDRLRTCRSCNLTVWAYPKPLHFQQLGLGARRGQRATTMRTRTNQRKQ